MDFDVFWGLFRVLCFLVAVVPATVRRFFLLLSRLAVLSCRIVDRICIVCGRVIVYFARCFLESIIRVSSGYRRENSITDV